MKRVAAIGLVVLVAIVGAGLTYLVQQRFAPAIALERDAQRSRALLDVLPAGDYHLAQLAVAETPLDVGRLLKAFLVSTEGRPTALILQVRTVGYGGPLELLVGISVEGKLLGVKTLVQSETPGLGGHVADSPNPWFQQLLGKALGDLPESGWGLKKDNGQFDQMSGATITSRAVINAVHGTLRYFDQQKGQLVGSSAHE